MSGGGPEAAPFRLEAAVSRIAEALRRKGDRPAQAAPGGGGGYGSTPPDAVRDLALLAEARVVDPGTAARILRRLMAARASNRNPGS